MPLRSHGQAVFQRDRCRLYNYDYYRLWRRWKKLPLDHLANDDAYRCHRTRRPYTVVVLGRPELGVDHPPSAVIEFRGSHIRMSMLDFRFREYLVCRFQEQDNKRVFLASATYHEFRGQSDSVAITEHYTFQANGGIQFQKYHFQNGVVALRSSKMNMLWNWESYPDFGNYDSMLEIRWVCHLDTV